MNNIEYSRGSDRFKLRAVAVIRRGDELLTCAVDGYPHRFLPGGKIQFGEHAQAALERELVEELGISLSVTGLRFSVEQICAEATDRVHEIAFYFDVDGSDLDLSLVTAEEGHSFAWMPLADLDAAELVPTRLPEYLTESAAGRSHFIENSTAPHSPSTHVLTSRRG